MHNRFYRKLRRLTIKVARLAEGAPCFGDDRDGDLKDAVEYLTHTCINNKSKSDEIHMDWRHGENLAEMLPKRPWRN